MRTFVRFLAAALVLAAPGVALAQWEEEATAAPIEEPATPPASDTATSRMAVGIESMAGAFTGPAFVYDAGDWHVDAILSWTVQKDAADGFRLGSRFYYVVKSSAQADLSLGGGLAYAQEPVAGAVMPSSSSGVLLEAGAKIRVFLVRQVALTGTFGGALGLVGDGGQDFFALRGDAVGAFGLVYFFR